MCMLRISASLQWDSWIGNQSLMKSWSSGRFIAIAIAYCIADAVQLIGMNDVGCSYTCTSSIIVV